MPKYGKIHVDSRNWKKKIYYIGLNTLGIIIFTDKSLKCKL